MTDDAATAQALFRLGQVADPPAGERTAAALDPEASRLHPDSWCIWRQGAGVTGQGLAALPDFWQRVDALGERRYYNRVDMLRMP